jgi:hypothetical protein
MLSVTKICEGEICDELVPAVDRRIGFVFNQSAVFDTGSVVGIVDFGFPETPAEHGSR